jgi:hypothetical protein
MTAAAYVPDTGDLIWTDFDPTKGREKAGRRPADGRLSWSLRPLSPRTLA